MQKRRSIVPAPDQDADRNVPARGKALSSSATRSKAASRTKRSACCITRRLERAGKHPLGFLASEYAMAVWGLEPMGDVDLNALFDEDMLGDDLESWLAESTLMKRSFRNCADHRRHDRPQARPARRTRPAGKSRSRPISSTTCCKQYEPDHILMQAAFADAGEGYLDLKRLGALLRRVKGRIVHSDLPHVSPFGAPVMLEMGRVRVQGAAEEAILEDAAALIAEAMG